MILVPPVDLDIQENIYGDFLYQTPNALYISQELLGTASFWRIVPSYLKVKFLPEDCWLISQLSFSQ